MGSPRVQGRGAGVAGSVWGRQTGGGIAVTALGQCRRKATNLLGGDIADAAEVAALGKLMLALTAMGRRGGRQAAGGGARAYRAPSEPKAFPNWLPWALAVAGQLMVSITTKNILKKKHVTTKHAMSLKTGVW